MNLHENTELFAESLTAASQPEERGGPRDVACYLPPY